MTGAIWSPRSCRISAVSRTVACRLIDFGFGVITLAAVAGLQLVLTPLRVMLVVIVALLIKEERTCSLAHCARREIHPRARAGKAHARPSGGASHRAHAIE